MGRGQDFRVFLNCSVVVMHDSLLYRRYAFVYAFLGHNWLSQRQCT